jgi:hypothetical protein
MRRLCVALLLVLLIPLLYVASYALQVEAKSPGFMCGIGPWPRYPEYRVGGKVAEMFFAPIHKLDKQIRPQHWKVSF